ncbi:MAG TPA: cytochrome c oxidase subunit 3 [Limnochordia bacterium]
MALDAAQQAAAAGDEQARILRSDWGGGKSPFRAHSIKLGMWFFLISDTLTFSGLLSIYGMSRFASLNWPDPDHVFHLPLVTLMTFILICSSATMAVAVGAARDGDQNKAVRWLGWTILGGLFFLGSQAYEWTGVITEGARLFTNPWGSPLFTASFFIITGFHGLHVTVGVIYLATVALRAMRGIYSGLGVEVAGLYWHFVDLVWVFIFTLFYLL